jgi:KipI family sensor histidine kinase inhibitor
LVVRLADGPGAEAAGRLRVLARTLARLPGAVESVPAPGSLVLHYRPDEIDYASLRHLVRAALERVPAEPDATPVKVITIPVRYDGPDLALVARATGLAVDDVVALHTGREYVVAMLGFVPGFAYLDELDPVLCLPRRPTPRVRVPPGSVAIAGGQTAVYPAATPGGWHLIGTTRVKVFDAAGDPPALFAVGDRVRFRVEPP